MSESHDSLFQFIGAMAVIIYKLGFVYIVCHLAIKYW